MTWLLNRKNENLIAFAICLACLIVYVPTVCPTVTFTDNGELATVAATMSVAHPTGYPLFTLIGRIAAMIPVGGKIIYRLNLFAALVTSIGVGLFFKVIREIQRASFFSAARNGKVQNSFVSMAAAIGATFALAFSSTVWSQATSIEVYGLHLLLVLFTTLYFIRGLDEQIASPKETSRNLFLFSFVLGLSFANHMTTILLAPGFLYLYFSQFGWNKNSFHRLLKFAPMFVLALSIYLVLPIRSLSNPPLDWGNPESIQKFFWHVTGKQYRVWMFEGWDAAGKQLRQFAQNFSSEFHPAVWIFLLLGCSVGVRERRRTVFVILLGATCLLYSINYDIHDISSYFLLTFVSAAILLAVGLERTFRFFERRLERSKGILAVAIILLIAAIQIFNNRETSDASADHLAESFAAESLERLPRNALVISGIWDYFVSPMYYFQLVEQKRRDIVVIDKSLLQNRVWYFNQLRRNYPEIYAKSQEDIGPFLVELEKFEHDEPFQVGVIQTRWTKLLNSIVRKNQTQHQVFVDRRIQKEFDPSFVRTPNGFFFQMSVDSAHRELTLWNVNYSNPRAPNDFTNDLRQYYVEMLVGDIQWATQTGNVGLRSHSLHALESIEVAYSRMFRDAPTKNHP